MSSEVAITLPGDIPGLLRRGAPLRYYGFRAVAVTDPCSGTLLLSDGVSLVKSGYFFVALDLSVPAGRDIAARWMAEKLGMKVGLTAPSFFFYPAFDSSTPGMTHRAELACWILEAANGNHMRFVVDAPDSLKERRIPGLPLDPDQGIEALRLCVLHLAGRL